MPCIAYITGKVAAEHIEWYAAPEEKNKGGYNVGTIRGGRIDFKFYKDPDYTMEVGAGHIEYQGVRR